MTTTKLCHFWQYVSDMTIVTIITIYSNSKWIHFEVNAVDTQRTNWMRIREHKRPFQNATQTEKRKMKTENFKPSPNATQWVYSYDAMINMRHDIHMFQFGYWFFLFFFIFFNNKFGYEFWVSVKAATKQSEPYSLFLLNVYQMEPENKTAKKNLF